MKRYCITLTHAALFAGSSLLLAQQPAPENPPAERPQRGPRMVPPVLAALDADKDGSLSAEEIGNAPAALKTLDKNSDGQLTAEEIQPAGPRPGRPGAERPDGPPPGAAPEGPGAPPPPGAGPDGPRGPRPGGPRGEGGPRMKPPFMAALDSNDDRTLSAEEIGAASTSLKSLDKNADGQLTPEELMPRGPRGPRGEGGPRGERGGRRGPGGPGGPGGEGGPAPGQ
jgi:hypothetical protein